jgi:repressor LexA
MKHKPAASNNVRALRKAAGLTLAQLAERMDPPADIGGLQKIETGLRNLTLDWMQRIAAALGVPPESLISSGPRANWVPLIGSIAAGSWREALAHPMGEVPVANAPPGAFALLAEGDSMDLVVPDGGYVVVDPGARDLVDGKIYAMQREDDATLKRFALDPPRLEPCSTNPQHRPIILGHEPVTVIGRVIWVVQQL